MRSKQYYQLVDDQTLANRWFLKGPIDQHGNRIKGEVFRVAQHVEVETPLFIPIRRLGDRLDWTFADFDMPVLSKSTAEVLSEILGSKSHMYEAHVEGCDEGCDEAYYIFNASSCVSCVDERKSEFIKWTPEDGIPSKVGLYRQMSRLIVDPNQIRGEDIFRVKGWRIALIASEVVKERFEQHNVTGISYLPV